MQFHNSRATKRQLTTFLLEITKGRQKDKTEIKFVCLEFIVQLERIFHSYGDVTIAGERLQILTFARHSWLLSSEGSLTCHTNCGTCLPFILVISEDP